jgi:hypothetical protein
MKQLFFILCLSLSFLSNVPVNKNRIERPQQYKFTFKNKDTVTIKTPDGSLSDSYNDVIVNGKKEIIEAELAFATDEKLVFKRTKSKWTAISISYKDQKVDVPLKILAKIPNIHFKTVALLWGDATKEALESGYFYLRFNVGKVKSFDKYDELRLGFGDKKLTSTKIVKQIESNSTKDFDF